MEARKHSMILAFLFALGAGVAACQTGYEQEPGTDTGSQTGQTAPSTGGAAGSPGGTTGGTSR